jgi:hypothetical protein
MANEYDMQKWKMATRSLHNCPELYFTKSISVSFYTKLSNYIP